MKTKTRVNAEATRLVVASQQSSDSTLETKSVQTAKPAYPPLTEVTKPNLTTAEIAFYTNQAEQTWRIHACKETFPVGLRPIRIGGRLNWPLSGVKKICGVQS